MMKQWNFLVVSEIFRLFKGGDHCLFFFLGGENISKIGVRAKFGEYVLSGFGNNFLKVLVSWKWYWLQRRSSQSIRAF